MGGYTDIFTTAVAICIVIAIVIEFLQYKYRNRLKNIVEEFRKEMVARQSNHHAKILERKS